MLPKKFLKLYRCGFLVLVLPLCIEVYLSSLTEKDSMSIILILLFGGIEMWGRKQMEQ